LRCAAYFDINGVPYHCPGAPRCDLPNQSSASRWLAVRRTDTDIRWTRFARHDSTTSQPFFQNPAEGWELVLKSMTLVDFNGNCSLYSAVYEKFDVKKSKDLEISPRSSTFVSPESSHLIFY